MRYRGGGALLRFSEATAKARDLAREGVLFTDLYATGTRTVRGLEALSAALPPLPGQSLVHRPGNGGLFTLGAALRSYGFDTGFLYGGYGYFDNMNAYFAANGYRVRDRHDIPSGRIGFANIWGIADEYLFDDALAQIDRAAATGRRQLLHLMTTSNHRPYTYPDGRIDIPSKTGRDGAVKYTDWAIGRFIEQARAHPWFDDTLFVIVADRCASVAGKTRLPPAHFRIPAIFYAPGYLPAATVSTMASQIDLAPTIMAWLGLDDGGRFLGQDLFGPAVRERAWIANYQEIGLLTPGEQGSRDLVVLSPMRRVVQFRVDPDGVERRVPLEPAKAAVAIAGGRVIVAPSSEVPHSRACRQDVSGWRELAGRMRAMLKAYQLLTLFWLVPAGVLVGVGEGLVRLLLGEWRPPAPYRPPLRGGLVLGGPRRVVPVAVRQRGSQFSNRR